MIHDPNPTFSPAATTARPVQVTSADGPLPNWLAADSDKAEPELSGRKPNRYIARSLADLAARCAKALECETWPSVNGLLQHADARAKLAGVVLLIGVCTVTHHVFPLILIYLASLLAAHFSHLPIAPFVRRVWLAVPIFVGGATLPVILNTVSPGRELFVAWLHPHLAVTAPGVMLAVILVLRVGVAVSLGALLALTTHWLELMSALRSFGVPRMFVSVLTMTYRYTILLMGTAAEIFLARTSRTVGRSSNKHGRRFVGTGIGSLFEKTLSLSEEVHNAMVSRGFTGDIRTYHKARWRASDSIWFIIAILLAASALLCDRWMGAAA